MRNDMQECMHKFLRQGSTNPRTIYSLEREKELLYYMVQRIAAERNTYRIENQRLMDEIARLRREVENKHE